MEKASSYHLSFHPWIFLLIVNLVVLFMRCFPGPGAMLLMVVPILHPMLGNLNINPVHFGVLSTINMEPAFITPPSGMNLFALSAVCSESVIEVVKGHIPFLILPFGAPLFIHRHPLGKPSVSLVTSYPPVW